MSSSEDLATPCLQPCTPVLPDGSGHNTASCHLQPARGWLLPPAGHGLIISQKCLQPLLSMSSWVLARIELEQGPMCCCMDLVVICELCQWEPVGPVILSMAHKDSEIGLYLLVHTLCLAISLWVVGSGGS